MGGRSRSLRFAAGLVCGAVISAIVVAGGFAVAQGTTQQLRACVSSSTGLMRLVGGDKPCKRAENAVTWNSSGPPGAEGPPGLPGVAGPAGPTGADSGFKQLAYAATFHFVTDACPAGEWRLAVKRSWGVLPDYMSGAYGQPPCKPIQPGMVASNEDIRGGGTLLVPIEERAGLLVAGLGNDSADSILSVNPADPTIAYPRRCWLGYEFFVHCFLWSPAGTLEAFLATDPELGPIAVYRLAD